MEIKSIVRNGKKGLENIAKNIKDNWVGLSLVALTTVSLLDGVYLMGRQMYNESKADVKIHQTSGETGKRHPTFGSGSTILGYDFDKDGKLDLIKEEWVWYGGHAAMPCERDYRPEDKEFQSLEKALNETQH